MVGDPVYTINEGGLDDFVIIAGTGGAHSPDRDLEPSTGDGLRLALGSGNPTVGSSPARVQFDLPRQTDVQLRVLDLSGRVVRTLIDGARGAGAYQIAWDRRDDGGRPVGSGVYLLRLVTPQGVRTQRMVMAH
jgi:hypothetical protein